MSKRTKWKMLAARFAAEKAGETPQQARMTARNLLHKESHLKYDYSQQRSNLSALFPLPISVEAANKLSTIELDGSSRFLPKRQDIPDNLYGEYSDLRHHYDYVQLWFFRGLNDYEQKSLYHKIGVDRDAALRIIRHTMTAMDSSREDKMAGCAYLLYAWFEIREN